MTIKIGSKVQDQDKLQATPPFAGDFDLRTATIAEIIERAAYLENFPAMSAEYRADLLSEARALRRLAAHKWVISPEGAAKLLETRQSMKAALQVFEKTGRFDPELLHKHVTI